MERTTSTIIFTVFAVIGAALLLMYVQKSLQAPQAGTVNLTQDDRGLFTPPPCDEQSCELSDTNASDCALPACVGKECVPAAKDATAGAPCVLPNGTSGSCDGNGTCLFTPCNDPRDDAAVCGSRECGAAADSCGAQRSCGSCGVNVACVNGACAACQQSYTVSPYINDMCSATNTNPLIYDWMGSRASVVSANGTRYLVYGWSRKVGAYNITQPMRSSYNLLGTTMDPLLPQQVSLAMQPANQGPWLHCEMAQSVRDIAVLDGFPYAVISWPYFGWDLLKLGTAPRLLGTGLGIWDEPDANPKAFCGFGGMVSPFAQRGTALFREGDNVYLVGRDLTTPQENNYVPSLQVLQLASGDGAVTPETKNYTTFPAARIPVGTSADAPPFNDAAMTDSGVRFYMFQNETARWLVVRGSRSQAQNSLPFAVVVDMADPMHPRPVALWNATNTPAALWAGSWAIDQDHFIIYDGNATGLYAIDVSDLQQPQIISATGMPANFTPAIGSVTGAMKLSCELLAFQGFDTRTIHLPEDQTPLSPPRTALFDVSDPRAPVPLPAAPELSQWRSCPLSNSAGYATVQSVTDIAPFCAADGGYVVQVKGNYGDIVKVDGCAPPAPAASCVKFETTYFNTSNDPDCVYPVHPETPYDCSWNEDPWIPRSEGGVVWSLGGKRFLIDADGGYIMRAYSLDNPAKPVRVTYQRIFSASIWTTIVMYPFSGFSVLDDDPVGYANFGNNGYVIFKYDPLNHGVTPLYQFNDSGTVFYRGKLFHVGNARYLVGRLRTNEPDSPDLSGISIYALGDDGVPKPIKFLDYSWTSSDRGAFWLYQPQAGDPILYVLKESTGTVDAWNLSDPTHPQGPLQILNESGQPFSGFPAPIGGTGFVFDAAAAQAYILDNGGVTAYDWSDPLRPKRLGAISLALNGNELPRGIAARNGLVYVGIDTSSTRAGVLFSFADPRNPKAVLDHDAALAIHSGTPSSSDILYDATAGRYYIYRSNFHTADEISVDGTCVAGPACPADDATYTTSRYITDVCSYPPAKDNVHSNEALTFATVSLGSERRLIYGWPNSLAVFNITAPMQASWTALPIHADNILDNNNQPQPLSLPTQLDGQDNPPGFLWIANTTVRSCAYDSDSHALLTDHLRGYATLDGFPYAYVDRGDWGWDILSIASPVHFLNAGPSPGTHRVSASECELIPHQGGSGLLFRNQGSVYLAVSDKIYLLSTADGSVTPETFNWKSAAPVGTLPVGLAQQSIFTVNAAYEHDGQQYILVSDSFARNISVINVSSPASPTLVTSWSPPIVKGERFTIDAQRSVLYRIADDGFVLYAYNISDLKNPVLLSTTTWSAATGTPFLPTLSLSGDMLVASASDNVAIINVKDPAHPALLRSQPGITAITPRNCESGERGTPDVLAFQQGGEEYFARLRTSDGDIVKVESCTLS